eukprot:g14.t1
MRTARVAALVCWLAAGVLTSASPGSPGGEAVVDAAAGVSSSSSPSSQQQYVHVAPCNTSESLLLVESLRLTHFSMRHDRIPGRRHLGLTGPDARRVWPDMVQVLPRKQVGPDMVARDYHVVDTQHVFMHGVAATQELIGRQAATDAQLHAAGALNARHAAELARLRSQTAAESALARLEARRAAEAQAERVRLELEQERVRGEEQRRTAAFERNQSDALLALRDRLARNRSRALDAMQRVRAERAVALQEESARKAELLRRATETALRERQLAAEAEQAELDRAAKLRRVQAEAEGRLRAERENEDVRLRRLRAQAEEDRRKLVETVTTALHALGQGLKALLADRQKLLTTVGALVALAAGVFIVREAAKLLAAQIERRLGRPSLVRETSRALGLGAVLGAARALLPWPSGAQASGAAAAAARRLVRQFDDVILADELKERVESLAVSVANARRHGAPFRHLMLYGPPGTGKTMVAKRLARASGLDYAIMSGGDVGPLGSDAVTQLHALFDWAKASPRGLLLFIDEAEAFLASRARRAMSEAQRNALNALLYQTGEQSSSFMLVLATNRPGDLDAAINDRVDEALSFPLPGLPQRAAMLKLYYHTYITATREPRGGALARGWSLLRAVCSARLSRLSGRRPAPAVAAGGIAAGEPSSEQLVRLAREVDGFSGREIAKLMVSVQGAAYGSADCVLSDEMLARVVRWKVAEHRNKARMARAGGAAAGEPALF